MKGSGPPSRPPAFITRLLARVLPDGPVGRSILGDLREEWHGRPAGSMRRLWYAWEASALALRYGAGRLRNGASGLGTDVVRGLGRLARAPGVTAVTTLALGLGIAAPTTMFSIADGLTRDLPVPEPDRLVHFGRRYTPEIVQGGPLDWMRPVLSDVPAVESVGLFRTEGADLSGDERAPERRTVGHASPDVLRTLRVQPHMGRWFTPADLAAGEAVVVLGWDLWQQRFGGASDVLERSLRVDGEPRSVVGVMPRGFAFPDGSDLWVPLDPAAGPGAAIAVAAQPGSDSWEAVGRLADGAALEALQEQVAAVNERLRARGLEISAAGGVGVEPWAHRTMRPQDRRLFDGLVLLAGLVLLVACGNVTHLLLARGLDRSREDAIRVALGSGRGRVVRRHLVEAGTLAALGGLAGLLLARAGTGAFERAVMSDLHWWMDVRLDLKVLAFTAGLIATAALLTGLLPAVQSGRVPVERVLRDGGRGSSGLRIGRLARLLVVGEVALTSVLLVVAGLMVKGALTNLRMDAGIETGSILAARFHLRPGAYGSGQDVEAFHRQIVEEVGARPGVVRAGLSTLLRAGEGIWRFVALEGEAYDDPLSRPRSRVGGISPGMVEMLGGRILQGRDLRWSDGVAGPRVALVNEAFVREHLEGRDPLGARLRVRYFMEAGDLSEIDTEPQVTVVGVVPTLGVDVGLDSNGATEAAVYLPVAQEGIRTAYLLTRAEAGLTPLSLVPDLRTVVRRLDPDLALHEVDSLEGHIAAVQRPVAAFTGLFLSFGAAGLLLATVGLFGLLSFTVRRRVRELGVRSALGAAPRQVISSALGAGLRPLGLGLVLGLGLAAAVTPGLEELLMRSSPRDPVVFGGVALTLALTGVLAALMPARRALRIDLVEALRSE